MAVDAALLAWAVRTDPERPVLRLYRWARPALSIGVHQRISDELVARCAERGVDLVRRPTGGTAVLHGDDLTYSVVAPSGGRGVLQAYNWVAEGLIAGLALLGIPAEAGSRGTGPDRPARALDSRSACFATTLGADLKVGGAKICGSAQVRRSGWFLQHGSIPMGDGRPLTSELLRHPGRNHSTCIELLRPGTTTGELAGALTEGFERRWGSFREVEIEKFSPEVSEVKPSSELILT
jgi:lipoate-protein ligase A